MKKVKSFVLVFCLLLAVDATAQIKLRPVKPTMGVLFGTRDHIGVHMELSNFVVQYKTHPDKIYFVNTDEYRDRMYTLNIGGVIKIAHFLDFYCMYGYSVYKRKNYADPKKYHHYNLSIAHIIKGINTKVILGIEPRRREFNIGIAYTFKKCDCSK